MVFENELIKQIIKKYRVIWALGHARALMSWDSQTYMPEEGVRERAIARSELSVLAQKLILKPEFVELVDKASQIEDLNIYEKGVVRVLQRTIRIMKALPSEFIAEYSKVTQEAMLAWKQAKEKNDYNIFKPYLEKIIELSKKQAEYLGWEEHPYDALVDLYEEGLRTRDVDYILSRLKKEIKRILDKIMSEKLYPSKHELEEVRYDPKVMEKVNKEVLKLLGFPMGKRARLDVSPHPFTQSMGIFDVRITTRYEGIDFKKTLMSTIHEYGHALYELQIDPALSTTPITGGVSLGIHEGQSRFWENIIGRSLEFIETIYPILKENLEFIEKYSPEEIYYYFNTVRPSLIRTEADEVTYNLHILLRAELEKLMVAGEIKADDLPELWNNMMEELLGVKPRNYSEGILQDIHWSMGNIGYFPTYTLGNLVAAQMRYHMLRESIRISEAIRTKQFKTIQKWQKEKIHKWGKTFAPKELLRRAFGEEYNPDYFIKYLEEKYLKH